MFKKDRVKTQTGIDKILGIACLILLTVTLISGCSAPISQTDITEANRDFLEQLISDTESEPIDVAESSEAEEIPDIGVDTEADTTPAEASDTTKKTPETTEKSEETTKKVDSADSKMVWIPTKGGKKYHKTSDCSNMDSPRKVTRSEAKSLGFTACKRCYK